MEFITWYIVIGQMIAWVYVAKKTPQAGMEMVVIISLFYPFIAAIIIILYTALAYEKYVKGYK